MTFDVVSRRQKKVKTMTTIDQTQIYISLWSLAVRALAFEAGELGLIDIQVGHRLPET